MPDFALNLERLPETASLADALALVERLNASPDHDGILVQSPLPKGWGAGPSRPFSIRSIQRRTWTALARRASDCWCRTGQSWWRARRPE